MSTYRSRRSRYNTGKRFEPFSRTHVDVRDIWAVDSCTHSPEICIRLRTSCRDKIKVCYCNGMTGRDGRFSWEVGGCIL